MISFPSRNVTLPRKQGQKNYNNFHVLAFNPLTAKDELSRPENLKFLNLYF